MASSHQNDSVETRLEAKRSKTAKVERTMRPTHVPMTTWLLSWHIWLMPGSAHIFFIVAIEVAMPACGLFMIEEAIAAPSVVVLAIGVDDMGAGTVAAGDMALAVAMIICATVEDVDVVLVVMLFMLGILAMSIFAVVLLQAPMDTVWAITDGRLEKNLS